LPQRTAALDAMNPAAYTREAHDGKGSAMRIAFAALIILLSTGPAAAVVIDGRLDPDYGVPWITQTTATAWDHPINYGADSVATAFGSELDAAYAVVPDGVPHLCTSSSTVNRVARMSCAGFDYPGLEMDPTIEAAESDFSHAQ